MKYKIQEIKKLSQQLSIKLSGYVFHMYYINPYNFSMKHNA